MGIDRYELRRDIGLAVRAMEKAAQASHEETKAEQDRLHQEWRDAVADAQKKEAAYNGFMRHRRIAARIKNIDAAALIAKAKRENDDLLVYREDPNETPVLCAASGLAIFDGDDLYGEDPQYGPVILKAAVSLKLSIEGPERIGVPAEQEKQTG